MNDPRRSIRRRLPALILGFFALALAIFIDPKGIAGQTATAPQVDATLESVTGGEVTLSRERGRRVVVLFYEDRPHLEDNEGLKGSLLQYQRSNRLQDELVVYGVANLGDLGNAAPHFLVRSMVRPLVDRWGCDILLDWDGRLRRAPFNFRTNNANIAVIGHDGRMHWSHTGRINEDGHRDFYRALRRQLRSLRSRVAQRAAPE